jgi:hypothetical protein
VSLCRVTSPKLAAARAARAAALAWVDHLPLRRAPPHALAPAAVQVHFLRGSQAP